MFLLPVVSVLPFLAAMTWPPWKIDVLPEVAPAAPRIAPVFDASVKPTAPRAPMSDNSAVSIPPVPAASDEALADKPARVPIVPPQQPIESAPLSRLATPGMPIATPLRLALLNVGADVSKNLVIQGKTPEDMAKDLDLDIESIYLLLTGRLTDVSIKTLDSMAKYLGASLALHLTLSGGHQ